jgi:hypothetical protein
MPVTIEKATIFALLVAAALPVAALAQQQKASPELQAMSAKIMREVSEGLQCQVVSIKLAKENEMLKSRRTPSSQKELPKAPSHLSLGKR